MLGLEVYEIGLESECQLSLVSYVLSSVKYFQVKFFKEWKELERFLPSSADLKLVEHLWTSGTIVNWRIGRFREYYVSYGADVADVYFFGGNILLLELKDIVLHN